jgi:hypothetical protein
MLKKATYFLFIFLLSAQFLFATDSTLILKHIKTIKGDFTGFSVDNLGNIYLITSTNQIKKISDHFDSIAIYNDVKQYGDIYSLDVTNPFKVLVYYKDLAMVAVLDRFLNVVNTIDLKQQNILQVRALSQSYDNKIWLFDELSSTIKKIDDYGNLLLESTDFRQLFDDVASPSTMMDVNGLLYLYNGKNGWRVFDYYGGFKKAYSLIGWLDVQVSDNSLMGRDSNFFYSWQPKMFQLTKIKPSVGLGDAIKVVNLLGHSYILKKDGLEIYLAP